jgi:mannose-6-phosphate isomerase-like protein (cupin superfamily)
MPFAATIPAVSTVLIDDDRSRVTRWDFEPGATTGWHRHGLAYVVIPLTDCSFEIEDAGGRRSIFVPAGAAYARDLGVEHDVRNGGDAPMSFIEVEIR